MTRLQNLQCTSKRWTTKLFVKNWEQELKQRFICEKQEVCTARQILNSLSKELGDLLARFLAKVFRFAIAAKCSCRMLCFLAATTALPASDIGP